MLHLYKVLRPSAHFFSFILCKIGAFDFFYRFYACVGCSMSHAHFCSNLVLENKRRSSLSIIDAVGRPRVVLK